MPSKLNELHDTMLAWKKMMSSKALQEPLNLSYDTEACQVSSVNHTKVKITP